MAAAAQRPRQPAAPAAAGVPWTQWGGPHRNFTLKRRASKTPGRHPDRAWCGSASLARAIRRPPSKAACSIRCTAGAAKKWCFAANAETGQTLWEHVTPMTFVSDAALEMGNGPYSTPLIVGDRVFTTGVAGRLQCFDKKSGKLLWTQELWTEHRGSQLMYGYASSPIAFRDTVVVPVGGRGKAVMAFQQADGKVAWSAQRFRQRLLVAGADRRRRPRADGAADGWRRDRGQSAQRRSAVAGAVQGRLLDRRVDAAVRARQSAVRLVGVRRRRQGDRVEARRACRPRATELWSSTALRLHHGNAMRIGDAIYFSSGGKGSQAILIGGRRAQRHHSLAAAQHREGHVRLGRQQADHARSGRQPDDRVSVASRDSRSPRRRR